MNKNPFDLGRLLLKARTAKRWWLPPAILIVLAVNGLGFLRPAKWTASTLVLIRKTQSNDSRVADTFGLGETLNTIREQINSFTFLAEVARQLNLDAGMAPDSKAYSDLIASMRKNLELQPMPDHFRLSYSGYSPQEASKVADAIVMLYIKQTTGYYGDKTKHGVDFTKSQLDQAIRELKQSQDKLREFKEAHIKAIPEALPDYTNRLAKRHDEQQTILRELESTSIALRQARAALDKETPFLTTEKEQQSENSSLTSLKAEERQLKLKIQMMLDVNGYTEEHWEIKRARKQLTLLEDELSSSTQQIDKESISTPNPAYRNLQDEITKAQSKIAQLRDNLQRTTVEIAELDDYVGQIPKNQDALVTLERDMKTAAAKVDRATMALDVERQASAVASIGLGPSFDYFDPPRVPNAPSSPNRVKIAALSGFLGGATALGLIFLLALLDSSIRSVDEARQILQMPVLGIVQSIVTSAQVQLAIRRRKRLWTGFGAVVLLVCTAGALGFAFYRDDIVLGVDRVREMLKQW